LYEHHLLFKDDMQALDTLTALAAKDGWVRGNLDMYKRLRLKASRDALQQQIATLISSIYTINQPRKRHITLVAAGK
jgi:hypothetical protein